MRERRHAAALAAAALLAACTEGMSPPLQDVVWEAEDTQAGAALLATEAGRPVLRLACQDDRFVAQAYGLTPVGSNEEFAIGTLDETVLLVADPAADVQGVIATGALPIPLLTSLMSAGAISVVYGDQTVGPLVLPAQEADPFVGACLAQLSL